MKVIWGFIQAVLMTALAGIIGAIFQEPIAHFFSPNRLVAEVFVAPWFPNVPNEIDVERSWTKQGITSYEMERIIKGDPIYVAEFFFRNNGKKRVDNIRVAFREHAPSRGYLINSGESSPLIIKKTGDVQLAPIDPGGTAKLVIWSIHNLNNAFAFNDLETFSSEGSIALNIKSIESKYIGDSIYAHIDTWSPRFLISAAIVLLALLLAGIVWHGEYIKQLMADEDFYLSEKMRFDLKPTAFKPEMKKKSRPQVTNQIP